MQAGPHDDALVIDAARRGDGAALSVLWRAHQPLLLRYLRGRGASEPEDVASQIWIDAARNLARFDGDMQDFRRWLFTIARRRLIDARRRAGRLERELVHLRDASPSTPGADAAYDDEDSLARALALVRQLPDKMADAVLLRYVADLSVDDTAGVLGIRAGHVRVLTHRGLARLEHMLAEQSGDDVTLPVRPAINPTT